MLNNLIINNIQPADLGSICRIHKTVFSRKHFTSNFSTPLLNHYFTCLTQNNEFALKISAKEELIGYLIGGNDVKKRINEFIDQHRIKLLLTLLRYPQFIWEKIEEKLQKRYASQLSYRLFLIGVDSAYKKLGIGQRIINHFEQQLLSKQIDEYGLSVRRDNFEAINFYIKHGYIEEARSNKVIYFKKKINGVKY